MITNSKPTAADWPKCPKCKSTLIVSGGVYFGCCSCGLSGLASDINGSPVAQLARGRISVFSSFGHRAVMKFYTESSSPEKLEVEQNMMIIEKSSQIARKISIESIYLESKKAITPGGKFVPMAVMNYRAENLQYVSVPLNNERLLKEAISHASVYDSCCVVWISDNKNQHSFLPQNASICELKETGFLMMCSHFYGAPSILSSTPFRFEGDKVKFGKQEFLNTNIVSWIKQPVLWGIISAIPGKTQPRWLSIREVPGVFNLSICIYEDLDSGPVGKMLVQNLSSPEVFGMVMDFSCETYEDGVVSVKKKIEETDLSLAKEGIRASVSFDREWEVDRDPESVIMELRTAESIWEKDAQKR